jgi:protein-tyrosine phosphatase
MCSQVTPCLFVSGSEASADREQLRRLGITHVVNCAARECEDAFVGEDIHYLDLLLDDSSREDVTAVVYAAFDWIECGKVAGGRTLVHCMCGISRSPAIAIMYLLWSGTCATYESAFSLVKRARPVANPSFGFVCQIAEWAASRPLLVRLRVRVSVSPPH